ncbi:type II secretion system F family protein [Methylophaga thiooxydans]|uniref:type II secretion system F family protein n=1 Tax=Methylophaga thiooxydans TaxID=392484 RepID=UPI00235580B6|nr:type II secretion system F family protein [Methylophaga thiooxydans]
MPTFAYQALSRTGEELSGRMQADSTSAVAQALRTEGLRVLQIKERRSSGFLGQENFKDWLATQRSVSTDALIFFYRQMAFMLRAGLPLAECLQLAGSQISSPRLNLALRLMYRDIENGQPLSASLRKHRDVFSDIAINLVVAGESTGELDVIMERLAVHLEKKSQLRKQLINALIYPVVVVLAAIGVASFMVVAIIPKFAQFIQGRGKRLPESTQALIDGAAFLRENGFIILAVAIAVILFVFILYKTYKGRRIIDRVVLSMPVMGKPIVYASMSQMNWALSILMRSGVTIFDSLKITADLLANKIYSDKLKSASDNVMAGRDLASSIKHPQIPEIVTHMTAIGERTGSLDRIQQELGVYYQELLEVVIKRLSAMIEPAMILVIGGMVGFVYYAFFQALFALAGR